MEWAMVPVNQRELSISVEDHDILINGVAKALENSQAIGLNKAEVSTLEEFVAKSEHPMDY